MSRFLEQARSLELSYPEVGATADSIPESYVLDHNRVKLGSGEAIFQKALEAVRLWKMFDLDWIQLIRPNTPIRSGETLALLVGHLGFWSLNACRIVYVIEEERRFGFAYGTLQEHAEAGEERFMVEWDSEDDSVCYDILAFSRPRAWQTWMAWPVARMLQKRFARESMLSMRRAVGLTSEHSRRHGRTIY